MVYAFCGALGTGLSFMYWATFDANSSTNSEAGAWLVGGALLGALVFAPIGAGVGLSQRIWGRWPRRPWILPLIGLVLGLCATSAGISSSWHPAYYAMWPFTGVWCGGLAHLLFGALVAYEKRPAPSTTG